MIIAVTPSRCLPAGVSLDVQSGAEPILPLLGNWSPERTLSIRKGQYISSNGTVHQGCQWHPYFLEKSLGANDSSVDFNFCFGGIMTDWNSIFVKALKELQADAFFTRGAILYSRVTQIAGREGLDFEQYLKETEQKFSTAIENVESIEIHKRPNTDMYVGFSGAKWPESGAEQAPRPNNRLRADVYEAFTRISESNFWYLPDSDEFSNEVTQGDSRRKVAVPSVTLESLLDQRRGFAEESGAREELSKAIERSANPLRDFQAEVSRLRLGQSWHTYKTRMLRSAIAEWAEKNGIEFSPDWVDSEDVGRDTQSPQQLMATFAAYMTDDEVRSISVPFRAVEAMYRSMSDPHR